MAIRLSVKDFSCIKNAEIELGALTVLIGPSASGKSVLSKLAFFFNDLLAEQWQVLEDGKGVDVFKEHVKEKFKEWFPVSAWGGGKFHIEFQAGELQIRISRVTYRKKLGENMRVWFSQLFEDQYGNALNLYRGLIRSNAGEVVDSRFMSASLELRERSRAFYSKRLGSDYYAYQMFIPAGRSFFTSVGKSIVAFEHGRILDPLILRFGRYYVGAKDRRFSYGARLPQDLIAKFDDLMCGTLVNERNKEYLKSADGRKIPLSALSSGQQELMPLILALRNRAAFSPPQGARQLIFIEEPEAHLFPIAQSSLVELMVRCVSLSKRGTGMFITTHSPYVLAKINNLIKARGVAGSRRGKKYGRVSSIIPEEYWIKGGDVRAYAIIDGNVSLIQDESDGLIEADYLDGVSGAIAEEFSELMEIEYL